MGTSTILRQALHELHAAHDRAVQEYGATSEQAVMLAEALAWMVEWTDRYACIHRAKAPLERR